MGLASDPAPDPQGTAAAAPLLAREWYWEQDEEFRFTRVVRPDDALSRAVPPNFRGRRWEIPGVVALSCTWDEHRRQLAAHAPFRDFKYAIFLPDAPARYLCASGDPVIDAAGAFRGYRGMTRDITDEYGTLRKLQEAQAQLQLAAALGRLGSWTADLRTGMIRWSDQVREVHEIPRAHKGTHEQVLQMYAPEYRDLLRGCYERCAHDGTPYDLEVMALTVTGERVWVRVMGIPQRDAGGAIVGIHGAFQDIHRMKTAAAELETRVATRTEELRQANQELESFAYSVAHDLRAPLSTIAGFCQVLVEREAGRLSDKGRDYLGRIHAAAVKMDQMTLGMLEFARLSRTALQKRPCDLAEIAAQLAGELREREPARSVHVEIQQPLPAVADRLLAAQALRNLVENAWKYTRRRSDARIEIGRCAEEGATWFFVRDNGVGFDMAHAGKLFEPFCRLHSTSEFEGSGVGLATVHKIVTRHGGRLRARSAPGEGTTVYFTL